jgi:hypothetical protein
MCYANAGNTEYVDIKTKAVTLHNNTLIRYGLLKKSSLYKLLKVASV